MEIVSNCAGRARFRDPALKREQLLAQAQQVLSALPGVDSVEANPRVGSLLVRFDPSRAALEALVQALSAGVGLTGEPVGVPVTAGAAPRRRRGTPKKAALPLVDRRVLKNLGLLATLSLSMGGVLFHLKKVHYLSGLAFLALSGDHVLERKRALFS